MAEGKESKLVYFIIIFFSLTAFGLAIAGERRSSIQGTQVTGNVANRTLCVHNTDVATYFGVGAVLLLVSTEALVMGVTRCMCLGRPMAPGGSRACTITLFVTSWISYFMAEACLIDAAKKNAFHPRYGGTVYTHGFSCASLRKVLFIAGAIFSIATMILNILYYRCFTRAINKHPDIPNSTVGMITRV